MKGNELSVRTRRRPRSEEDDLWEDPIEEDDGPSDDPLDGFLADGLITEVIGEVKSGKEGTVYACRANPSTGEKLLAGKVYRAQEHRTFKHDHVYRQGRFVGETRVARAMAKRTSEGRQAAFAFWIMQEWDLLRRLHPAGANVPRPVARAESAILMSYLGDEEAAAPLLNNVALTPAEARPLFEVVLRNIELFLANDCVHGDLSPYNILYWEGAVTIIDFPQAVDPRFNDHAYDLLERDIQNVCRYFGRYGIRSDPERITRHLWGRFRRSTL